MNLNHNLLCPKYLEAYFAVETKLTSTTAQKKATASTEMFKFNNNNSSNHNKSEWTPCLSSTITTRIASAVQVADLVQQVYERVRKERQKAHAACWLQLSMFQTYKMTPDGDLTHDMKAIQKHVISYRRNRCSCEAKAPSLEFCCYQIDLDDYINDPWDPWPG
ncbi:J domain-containing protein [Abeliophyllum distichum]|uniref:J domain-containing protein n=1 Tax=Abeliophyllum distichum TaxID=126358 RepID=A0ABD1QVP7_9LAMI